MVALMWLVFLAIVGTGHTKFPKAEDLEQYIVDGSLLALKGLHIRKIPDNAFGNYPNITVRITR